DEFNRYYVWPLRLAEKGLWRYVVHLLGDYNNGVRYEDALLLLGPYEMAQPMASRWLGSGLRRMLPQPAKRYLRQLKNRVKSRTPANSGMRALRAKIDQLRDLLSKVTLPKGDAWTKYYEEFPKHGQGYEQSDEWN